MKKIKDWFDQHQGRLIIKHSNYLDVYERYLSKFRGKTITVLEIGVCHGGSLELWRDYFGESSQIVGIDINPNCKNAKSEGIKVFIGDQCNISFLKDVIKKIGNPDIIIDDGGHKMKEQINSFHFLYDKLNCGGVYICEDVHTSYIKKNYGGGYRKSGTFIEYSKSLIDYIHSSYFYNKRINDSIFSKFIKSIHFYDSIIVIEKEEYKKPETLSAGVTKIEELSKISLFRHPRKWVISKLNR